MKKFTALQQLLMFAAVTAAGYFVWYSFKETPKIQNQPDVPAILPVIEPAITPDEKLQLFITAMGYRGGAAPPPFILEEYQANAQAALLKIDQLGLMAEWELYRDQQAMYPAAV